MKKAKTQTNSLLIALVGIIAVIALCLSAYTLMRLRHMGQASMQQGISLHTLDARLRFCHDKQIIPCDDGPIRQWNEAHPDERMVILPY